MLQFVALPAALLVALSTVDAGSVLPTPDPAAPRAQVGPELRRPAVDLQESISEDLRLRRWDSAADALLKLGPDSVSEQERSDWAFLAAWSLAHAERASEARDLLPLLDESGSAPPPYVWLVRGEVLRSLDEGVEALTWLEKIPDTSFIWGRAAVQRAEVMRELGRTQEAFELYEQIARRPDPSLGNAEALLALGLHYGGGSAEAYPYLRRLWYAYPRSESAGRGASLLGEYKGAEYRSTWQEVALRSEVLMGRGEYRAVLDATDKRLGEVADEGEDACRFVYTRGRSEYKTNGLTASIATFGEQGQHCGDAPEYGAKILYLKGMAEFRKRKYTESAATFETIADLYPDTSFADDGLTHAGIALQEADDLAGAQERWRRTLDYFPQGDTAAESTWRLAFSLYLEGDPDGAVDVAEALGALPLANDPVHVAAGRYWHARWLLYPDVAAPDVPHLDPERRETAVAEWKTLCEELPHSFYALLAAARLAEEAPEVMEQLLTRPDGHAVGDLDLPWEVRDVFLAHPGIEAGVGLLRLGLVSEAAEELDRVGIDAVTPDERAWLTELRIRSGDWLLAHDDFRKWLRSHPPSTLGDREPQVLRVAYPDRYWDEVQSASAGDRYESRLLHALVREESNFNTKIRSHAGALGLSQLMPATAAEVAGWMGISVTNDDLSKPDVNLKLGARYFDTLHKQFEGSPYLSLAGYNAGGGRVNQWLGEWGNVPTDEYVERIPFKETREYVKRVMGTWQTMRWQFDAEVAAFPDLSPYNHHALPEATP